MQLDQRLVPTLHFLLRLLILATPLYLTLALSIDLFPLQYATASQTAAALRDLGYTVSQDGALLSAALPGNSPFHFFISEDSTAWKSFLLYFAFLFAVPAVALRKRLIGLALGLPALWLGNFARVLAIVFVETAYGVQAALFTHDYLWRFGLVCLVLGIWALWLRWVLPARPRAAPRSRQKKKGRSRNRRSRAAENR